MIPHAGARGRAQQGWLAVSGESGDEMSTERRLALAAAARQALALPSGLVGGAEGRAGHQRTSSIQPAP
jgi:hypothetical protein